LYIVTRKLKIKGVDPSFLDRQKESMLRRNRQVLLLNDNEKAAVDEFCRRYKVQSRASLLREMIMEKVLEGLNESHPTLF